MKYNMIVQADNVNHAFESWYEILSNDNLLQESRDGEVVGEVINAITIIEDPTRNIVKSKIRNMPMRYAIGELLWYLSGDPSLDAIRLFTNAWDRMSDDGITVNSNYGWCIKKKYGFDQWEWCKEELRKNSFSRRAIIHIKEPNDKESKDVNCTVSLQFFVRENKLYMTTYMRSNDLWMGFVYDVFQFTCMQILMSMELGLELGTYTHIAGSLHLYKRDYEKSLENTKGENNV